jgi:hypothetical protein
MKKIGTFFFAVRHGGLIVHLRGLSRPSSPSPSRWAESVAGRHRMWDSPEAGGGVDLPSPPWRRPWNRPDRSVALDAADLGAAASLPVHGPARPRRRRSAGGSSPWTRCRNGGDVVGLRVRANGGGVGDGMRRVGPGERCSGEAEAAARGRVGRNGDGENEERKRI